VSVTEGPDNPAGGEPFLRRWSQRKLAAARAAEAPPSPPATPVAPPPSSAGPAPEPAVAPPEATTPEAPPLPDVASLTFDSDFTAFLAPEVEEGTRRAALRKLFSDPHFNVMDGLDVYIDDYSKFEPITPDVLKQLSHVRYLFDPPKTRVNEQGYVEDVVDEPAAPAAAADEPAAPAAAAADEPAAPAAAEQRATPASPSVDVGGDHDAEAAQVPLDVAQGSEGTEAAPAASDPLQGDGGASSALPSDPAPTLPAAVRTPR
jgi:hypothetical protein